MAAKKPDPISDKARSLEAEIAALEAEIKKLDSQLQRPAGPKFRSTATRTAKRFRRRRKNPLHRRRRKLNRFLRNSKAVRSRRAPGRKPRKFSTNWACANTICRRCGTACAIIFTGRRPAIRAWSIIWRPAAFTACGLCATKNASRAIVSSRWSIVVSIGLLGTLLVLWPASLKNRTKTELD